MSAPLAGDAVWLEASHLFGNRHGMRPKKSWSYGYSSRVARDRLQLLCESPAAARLYELVAPLDRAAFSKLMARSLVNLEQARAGFRISLIGNITVPIGALVVLNELAPGWLAETLRAGTPNELLMIATTWSVAAVLILGGLWWAYGGLSAARDLHHLLYLIRVGRFGDADASLGLDEDDEAFPGPP
jgi:hypothetical protein